MKDLLEESYKTSEMLKVLYNLKKKIVLEIEHTPNFKLFCSIRFQEYFRSICLYGAKFHFLVYKVTIS